MRKKVVLLALRAVPRSQGEWAYPLHAQVIVSDSPIPAQVLISSSVMTYSKQQLWERYQQYNLVLPSLNMSLDISRMNFPDSFLEKMEGPMAKAFEAMDALEKGAVANKDENRMVGHYWLRNSGLAPAPSIRSDIDETVLSIKRFAMEVHSGKIRGPKSTFKNLLLIGIGGSALGPQFVARALGQPKADKLVPYFFDNTDPDGIDNVLSTIGDLFATLCVVVSKSGGTKETRNGMIEAENAFRKQGLSFGAQAVAVTSDGSQLSKYATENKWLKQFPMWDWVGGRTSELSAVGLVPAALQGIDIDALLTGARACDEVTRQHEIFANPAALMAAMWFYAGEGKGTKNMVVLPYKDRLELFSKYLQQLVMESIGKELDRTGKKVNQGITVLGNKGATDQHSYIQQLREGPNDFFAQFIAVQEDRSGLSMEVEPATTSGDYLLGFLLGTRQALYENGRESMFLKIKDVSPFSVGALIALFERAVGLYAELININAYHQPGVEAGKKAAGAVLTLQGELLQNVGSTPESADQLAKRIGNPDEAETVYHLCEHLAGNGRLRKLAGPDGDTFFSSLDLA